MAAQKCLFDKVDNFDSIHKPISSANIHCIVTSLSAVTKGWKNVYFNGTVSDGASNIRLVGFNSKQQKLMEDFMSKRQPIQLSDCKIKQARRGDKMEILLKANTSIGDSPKKSKCRVLNSKITHPHWSCCRSYSWMTLMNEWLLKWK